MKNVVCPIIVALASAITPAHAQQDGQLTQLVDIYEQGDCTTSYELATKLRNQFEGEEVFDEIYGYCAAELGMPAVASYALMRLVANLPGNLEHRLALAEVWTTLQNNDLAEAEYQDILRRQPSAELRQKVERRLDKLAGPGQSSESNWSHYLDFGGGWSDNINLGPDGEQIEIRPGEPSMNNTNIPDEAAFSRVLAASAFQHVFGNGKQLSAQLSLFDQNNEGSDDFDVQFANLNLGFGHGAGPVDFSWDLDLQTVRVAGDAYWDAVALGVSRRVAINESQSWTVGVDITDFENEASPVLSNVTYGLGLQLDGRNQNWAHQLGFRYEMEDATNPDGEAEARQGGGIEYQITREFSDVHQVNGLFGLSSFRYQDELPSFDQRRQDTLLSAALEYQYAIRDWLRIRASYAYVSNQSNLSLYEYDSNQLMVSLVMQQ